MGLEQIAAHSLLVPLLLAEPRFLGGNKRSRYVNNASGNAYKKGRPEVLEEGSSAIGQNQVPARFRVKIRATGVGATDITNAPRYVCYAPPIRSSRLRINRLC